MRRLIMGSTALLVALLATAWVFFPAHDARAAAGFDNSDIKGGYAWKTLRYVDAMPGSNPLVLLLVADGNGHIDMFSPGGSTTPVASGTYEVGPNGTGTISVFGLTGYFVLHSRGGGAEALMSTTPNDGSSLAVTLTKQ